VKYNLKAMLEGVLDDDGFWSSEDNNWHMGAGVFYMYNPQPYVNSTNPDWIDPEDGSSKWLYGVKRGNIHGKTSHSFKHASNFIPNKKGMRWTAQGNQVPVTTIADVKNQVVEKLKELGYTNLWVQKKPRGDTQYPIVSMSIDDPKFVKYIFCGLDWINDRIRKGWKTTKDELEVLASASFITETYDEELKKFIEDNKDAKDVSDKNFSSEDQLLAYLKDCFDDNKAIRFKIRRKNDESKLYEVLYSMSDSTYTSVEMSTNKRGTFMRMEPKHSRRTFWRALTRFAPISARDKINPDKVTFNGNELTIGYSLFAQICQSARERFEESIFGLDNKGNHRSDWSIDNKYKADKKGKNWTATGARVPKGEILMKASYQRLLGENKKPAVLDDSIEAISNIIKTSPVGAYGYNVLSATLEDNSMADIVYTVILQHAKPNFGMYVDEMIARGGKFAKIYDDTPTSKTQLTRWLTGFKADPDDRQKSAAIKIAQVAGLDCLNNTMIKQIEDVYDCTVVANFTGAKTNKKGQSFFELFVFDHGQGPMTPLEDDEGIPQPVVTPPPAPKDIPVDEEVIEIPVRPVPPKPKKKKKSRKRKKLKLTSDQRKAGYNQIDQEGRVRHVVPLDELEDISDHIVDLVLSGGGTSKRELLDPMGDYTELKNRSYADGLEEEVEVFRVVDDYYEDDAPIMKMYKGYVIEGGQIRSRSMMQQYMSLESNRVNSFDIGRGHYTTYSPNYARDQQGEFTPPKLGGKQAKDARRYVQQQRVNDEIIMYAILKPKTNKFTGKMSKHTGHVTLYLFLLDRNLEQ